ncbi:M48 family metalloprotease, partial [Dissulfurirhabdus thermomarina]
MDFFERQDRARRRTAVLVILFAAAVILTVAAANLAVFLAARWSGDLPPAGGAGWLERPWWLVVTAATLAVILGGTLRRHIQLRSGGRGLAALVGARRVEHGGATPAERRLSNVVEEMAIAAGLPAPELYVLDGEPGINAFVAGFTPSASVLVVTRGALDTLTRDELQGVVAHEFSHILNGDMRINLRLVSVLAGILAMGQMGRAMLRGGTSTRSRRRIRIHAGGFWILAALALYLAGAVGVFFGRLIKAAIARQRELLADAAAVQFTRNPAGIVGALLKIEAAEAGSRLRNLHAEEMSHMCFGETLKAARARFLATHPTVPERVRALDPSGRVRGAIRVRPAAEDGREAGGRPASPEAVVGRAGDLSPVALAFAVRFREGLPPAVRRAARTFPGARALVYALVRSGETAGGQETSPLTAREDAPVARLAHRLAPAVRELGPAARLPLLDLAL